MKVLFVGEWDNLSSAILERMDKEGHTIFFLSEKKISTNKKEFRKYHKYVWPESKEDVRRIFASITPNVVIYGGVGYLDVDWTEEQRENVKLLSIILEECSRLKECKFILLSSIEACWDDIANVQEEKQARTHSLKRLMMLQEEKMTEIFHKQMGIDTVILRLAQVYDNEIMVGAKDWLGELAANLVASAECVIEEQQLQPIHVYDVADAVIRVLDGTNSFIYDICGSEQITKSEIAKVIVQGLNLKTSIEVKDTGVKSSYVSNLKLKEEKEWVEIWDWKRMVDQKKFTYSYVQKEKSKGEQGSNVLKNEVRKTIESIVIFLVFCLIYLGAKDHVLFSQVDWLLIYVTIVSLVYGVKQSTLAVVLASITYLISQGTNITEMTNFYSYAGSVLMIVEFLFFGTVVGYSVDMLREEIRNHKNECAKLSKAYTKLEEINDKNVLIKNEYEKRVLEAKTSLPKLYSIINKIGVLDINRIFMEILHVVEELMNTDTVAVYRVSQNNSYLRLIASLNEESVMEGNSWNLANYPNIEQAIRQNEIYEGDIWKNEPAIVLPMGSFQGCEAAIVIKKLPLEAQSLYSVNMLRTLLALSCDSVDKALQYDNIVREQKYHKDINVLLPEEFQKAVALAEEKKSKRLAECCIIKMQIMGDMISTYHKAEKMFREMDIWGSDEEGNLYVLLGNTSSHDAQIVLNRLTQNGIYAEKMENFS